MSNVEINQEQLSILQEVVHKTYSQIIPNSGFLIGEMLLEWGEYGEAAKPHSYEGPGFYELSDAQSLVATIHLNQDPDGRLYIWQPSILPEMDIALKAVSALGVDPSVKDFFVPGHGDGRGLLEASVYGFANTHGIEYQEEVHELACANIEGAKSRGLPTDDVSIMQGDALKSGGFLDAMKDNNGNKVVYLYHLIDETKRFLREFFHSGSLAEDDIMILSEFANDVDWEDACYRGSEGLFRLNKLSERIYQVMRSVD